MGLFKDFLEVGFTRLACNPVLPPKKTDAILDLIGNAMPWIVGAGFLTFGGAYGFGLECYLGIDYAKNVRDNLKKSKMLSDAQRDFYTLIGTKIITEEEYNKIHNKRLGKISDANSVLAQWRNIYDK